jgi:IS30 family transposase
MKRRQQIIYTAEQRALMWDRYQQGDSLADIARLFGRFHSSVERIIAETGGVRPPARKRSSRCLSLSEREEISRGIVADESTREIANRLSRSASTISREINRNGGYHHSN